MAKHNALDLASDAKRGLFKGEVHDGSEGWVIHRMDVGPRMRLEGLNQLAARDRNIVLHFAEREF